jgi:hypothetical protein
MLLLLLYNTNYMAGSPQGRPAAVASSTTLTPVGLPHYQIHSIIAGELCWATTKALPRYEPGVELSNLNTLIELKSRAVYSATLPKLHCHLTDVEVDEVFRFVSHKRSE